MSSWFSDLAGKAENILNKIDQNAASVLKNDVGERDQLLEVKTSNELIDGTIDKTTKILNGSALGRNMPNNSMKLPKTPKKSLYPTTERTPLFQKDDTTKQQDSKHTNAIVDDGNKLVIPSNASNSSRRSSCSSRTEGIQTVIEYPITKHSSDLSTTNTNGELMNTSISSLSSLQSTTDDKTEMMATKIILAQMKVERDQMRAEIAELKSQLAVAQTEDLVSELTATCDQLAIDKENLQRKLQEIEDANNGYVKNISQLEVSIAKMHEITTELNEKLAMAKTETEQTKFELQQYRSRAQHTLQMKDELIAELKSMHTKNGPTDDADIDAQCKQIEYMSMKQERDSLLEETNMLHRQLNSDKQILVSLENKIHDMRETKLSQQQNTTTAQIAVNNTDERIYSLTQSLVQKQNSLETITAERNAIRLQLEKLENQHRETMQLLRHQRLPQIINVNDTDDAKSQVPNFMRENPFDTRVARGHFFNY